jgi:class 3 adenylate cyclase
MKIPDTRYAETSDGVYVAYQVLGKGPIDLVFAFGWLNNVDSARSIPEIASFYRHLAAFSRLIIFDRRGTGLSDRVTEGDAATFEAGMDDIRAVMDAAGSERALQVGFQDGGMLCALFAASFPERALGLVIIGSSPVGIWAPDAPWGWTEEEYEPYLDALVRGWGTSGWTARHMGWMAPSFRSSDRAAVERFARHFRACASPGAALAIERMLMHSDVRAVLPTIQVPTLVIHNVDDAVEEIEAARYTTGEIPGAELVELPFTEHAPFYDSATLTLEAVETFASQVRAEQAEFDRVLATVLFTDIVDSTAQGAAMGDHLWRDVQQQHDRIVRANLARYRGREIKTMGDGFLATFDGPARGVKCAESIAAAMRPLGIEIRAGLHTGEVAFEGDDVSGLGVAIGARVGALAGASEVLVSQTVKDLVAGSGLTFEDAGEHELKGVPDRWRLYRVVS